MKRALIGGFSVKGLPQVGILAAFAIMLTASELFAQEAAPPGSADAVSQGNSEHQPTPTLLPFGKAALGMALLREQERNTGRNAITFPLPTCAFPGGLCGAVDRDGNVVVAPVFDWVDIFHEGRALVRSAGRYGYVDETGRVVIEPQYELAEAFAHGVAQIDVAGKSGLIDRDGHTVLEARFGYIPPFTENAFWVTEERRTFDGPPGLETFCLGRFCLAYAGPYGGASERDISAAGKWGLLDRSGRWIRPPEFSSVSSFDDKSLMWAKIDAGWGLIRPDGTWQIEPRFAAVSALFDGLAPVDQRNGRAWVNAAGEIMTDLAALGASREFAPRKRGNLYGFVDRSGAWVVEPKYDGIAPVLSFMQIPATWWLVMLGGKFGLLDDAGHEIASPQFDHWPRVCPDGSIVGLAEVKLRVLTRDGHPIEPPQGELWGWSETCDARVVKVGDKYGYVDTALRPITPPHFDEARAFSNGFAVAKFEGRYGLLRSDGSWAIEPNFDAMAEMSDPAVVLARSGRAGVIDVPHHGWAVAPNYDAVCAVSAGLIMTNRDGKRGVMDTRGTWLIQPNFTALGPWLDDGLVPAQIDGKWAMVDTAGTIVLAPKYDGPTFFSRGVNWAKSGSSWCPIDRHGQRIPSLQCQASDPMRRDFSRMFDCSIR